MAGHIKVGGRGTKAWLALVQRRLSPLPLPLPLSLLVLGSLLHALLSDLLPISNQLSPIGVKIACCFSVKTGRMVSSTSCNDLTSFLSVWT